VLVPAVSVFLANIVGLGLGPYRVGAASDFAGRSFPDQGLRVALAIISLFYVVSAVHYWRAARWLARSSASPR